MLKKTNSRLLRMVMTVTLVAGFILAMGIVTANAATTPKFTSATYNVGTGALVITGADIEDGVGTAKDIDLAKLTITNGKNYKYTLTSPKLDKESATSVKATLNAKDAAALAQFLDKDGTSALNGGTYQIDVLAGWNGKNSTNDFTANALTVSGVTTVTSAEYVFTTGVLTIKGTNLVAIAGTLPNDIAPKYLTITDSASKTFTLSSATKAVNVESDGNSAIITLDAKDKLALEAIFDKDGTKTIANNNYNLVAAYGWNGKNTLAVTKPIAITVSGYVAPTATLKQDLPITVKTSILATAELKANKAGTIYIVTPAAVTAGPTQSGLEAYVASKDALKATVTTTGTAIVISTSTLKLTKDTDDYVAVLVDKAGVLSANSTQKITINNIAAPALTATAAKGTTSGTKVTATVTASTTNTLAYKVSSSTIATPKLYTDTTGLSLTSYTSGNDITTVDATTNKYLAMYEINTAKQVIKFKLITLSATLVKAAADTTAPTATVSTQTVKGGANVTVQSSEVGVAYLVSNALAATAVDTVTELDALLGAVATKVTVAAATTNTTILAPATAGTYAVVVVDAAGNVATKSANLVTVDNTAATYTKTAQTAYTSVTLTASEALYIGGTAVANGADIKAQFTATLSGGATVTSALYNSTTHEIVFTIGSGAAQNDTIAAKATLTDIAGNASATSTIVTAGGTTW